MGIQIPCLLGDTKNTEGVQKPLGDLTRGCEILGGAGPPMTPGTPQFQHAPLAARNLLARETRLAE